MPIGYRLTYHNRGKTMELYPDEIRSYAGDLASNVAVWLDAIRSDNTRQAMLSVQTMENRLRQMRALSEAMSGEEQ